MLYSDQLVEEVDKLTKGTVASSEMNKGMLKYDPLVVSMDALYRYAVTHKEKFGSLLSEDYVLGPYWLNAITGVRDLLCGTGTFDSGTLESLFWKALDIAGYKEEDI